MVLDVDGEVLLSRLDRNALRNGPRREGAVALEPKVVVEPARGVPLHDRSWPAGPLPPDRPRRTAPASAPGRASAGTAPGSRVVRLPEAVFRNRGRRRKYSL